jgi:hypothetical protein
MQVVYTPKHLLHDPATEIEASTTHSPFEHTGRAETIKSALAADSRFSFREPTEHGTAPIKAIHDEGLIDFLSSAIGVKWCPTSSTATRFAIRWVPPPNPKPSPLVWGGGVLKPPRR